MVITRSKNSQTTNTDPLNGLSSIVEFSRRKRILAENGVRRKWKRKVVFLYNFKKISESFRFDVEFFPEAPKSWESIELCEMNDLGDDKILKSF